MSTFFTDLLHILQNPYIALIFFTALVFDFINGFHDAANSIATIVGTRVLRPFQAVCWAAWWNGLALVCISPCWLSTSTVRTFCFV